MTHLLHYFTVFGMHCNFVKGHIEGDAVSDQDVDSNDGDLGTGNSCEELERDNSESNFDSTDYLQDVKLMIMHLSMSPSSPRGFDQL